MAFNITFNGQPIPSFVKVTGVRYTALPELQHNLQAKTSGVGLIDNGTQILGKTVSIDFVLVKDHRSILQLSQEFAKWLIGNDFKLSPLAITDGETITYQAKVSNNVQITDAWRTGEGTVEFLIPTGVAQGSNAPITVNGNTITVDYTGSAISYPVIICNVSATTTMLSVSSSNGGRITVHGNFRAGDTVVFDCLNKRIKVNGYINMKGMSLDSTWLSFPTEGSYTITGLGSGSWTCTVPLRYY